jgi:hypothetical protein
MKKTLITLMALGACAFASTDLPLATQAVTGTTLTFNSDAATWEGLTVAATLNVGTIKSWATTGRAGNYSVFTITGSTTQNNPTAANTTLGLTVHKEIGDTTTTQINGRWGDTYTYGSGDANNPNLSAANFWNNVSTASVVFMHSGGGTEGQVVLTLGYNDQTTQQYSYTLSNFKCSYWYTPSDGTLTGHYQLVKGLAVYDSRLTEAEAQSVGIAALSMNPLPTVPEPATATLSLLALAGLAMRRRRK